MIPEVSNFQTCKTFTNKMGKTVDMFKKKRENTIDFFFFYSMQVSHLIFRRNFVLQRVTGIGDLGNSVFITGSLMFLKSPKLELNSVAYKSYK